MDERVEEGEDPDGRGHVSDASPHAHHGTSVVVSLESGGPFALCEDDGGVEDFVELGEVEEEAKVGESTVPETADVCSIRQSLWSEMVSRVRVCHGPSVGTGIVDGSVAESPGPVDLAETVDDGCRGGSHGLVWPGEPEGADHAEKGPERVDGEEDIVEDDEEPEGAGLADGPGTVVSAAVEAVDVGDCAGVSGRDGDGDSRVQEGRVDGGRDVERAVPGDGGQLGGREDGGAGVWRKSEEGGGRRAEVDCHGHK